MTDNTNQDQEKKAVIIRENYINPTVWEQFSAMAQTFFKSGAYPSYIKNAPQLMVVFQAGYEMGMKPQESLKSLYIVNGVVNVWGAAAVRRLREHGWSITYKDEAGQCTATIKKGDETYSETCTFEDAHKSGYTVDREGKLKFGWKEGLSRKLKLRYGAISILLKTDVTEVLGSAVDIVEVYEDAAPVMKAEEAVLPEEVDHEGVKHEATTVSVPTGSLQDRLNKKKDVAKETDSVPPVTYSTDSLRKKFFAVAKEYGLAADDAKDLIKKKYKVESMKDLTPEQYLESITILEKKLAKTE